MKALVLTLLCAQLGGCATLLSIIGIEPEPPKVSFKSVEISSMSLTSIDMLVIVQVENKNNFALKLAGMTYQVKLLDADVASGTLPSELSIAEHATADVALPIKVNTAVLRDIASRLFKKHETLVVRLKASLNVVTPYAKFEVPIDEQKVLKWEDGVKSLPSGGL